MVEQCRAGLDVRLVGEVGRVDADQMAVGACAGCDPAAATDQSCWRALDAKVGRERHGVWWRVEWRNECIEQRRAICGGQLEGIGQHAQGVQIWAAVLTYLGRGDSGNADTRFFG